MSRSIELGRAVLCSPTTNLELWLTTLITLSLTDENNMQQLKSAHLLDYLASGDIWVGRSHGMHARLKISIGEEPLAHRHLRDLTDAILQAPIWEQLMLKPSLPVDLVAETGIIHLDITHANGPEEEQKRHRLFTAVPAADVHPPDGVPSISLQSVRFTMDVMETSPRRRPAAKRSNTFPGERKSTELEAEHSDTLLFDMTSVNDASHAGRTGSLPRTTSRKRKRPATDNPLTTQSAPIDSAATLKRSRRRPATDSYVQRSSPLDEDRLPDRVEIENIVDGALRLSICGGLGKTANGLKVKASTFRLGLADVSPALWRNGYLSALSQRAHLLPTLARSFTQTTCVKATSMSLQNKTATLVATSHQDPIAGNGIARLSSLVVNRLWVHLQKSLFNKSTTPLQACVASSIHGTPNSDEMLVETEQRTIAQHQSSFYTAPIGLVMARYPHRAADDGHMILPGRSVSSVNFHDHQRMERMSEDLIDAPVVQEFEDDFLVHAKPYNLNSTGYPTSTHSAVLQEPTTNESQRSLGTSLKTKLPPEPTEMPMLAESESSYDEESLFEDCREHDIKYTEELLLAF